MVWPLLVIGSVVLFHIRPARGGGMNIPDNGTRNLARGGASVAWVADPSAIYNNPAGLAAVKGTNLLFDNNLVNQQLCFDRAGTYPGEPGSRTYGGQPYPKVCRMNKGMFYIPMVAGSFDFGLRDWTFALGGYGPHAVGRRRFPHHVTVRDAQGQPVRAPSPTRYDTSDMDIVVIFFTAAAAWRPVDWFDLGIALQPTLSEVRYATYVPLSEQMDPDSDIFYRIHTKGFALTGLLGSKIRPSPNLEIGVSLRLPVHSNTKGDACIHLPASMSSLGQALKFHEGKAQVRMTSDLPLYLRAGIRYRWLRGPRTDPFEIADLELDVHWERWSAIRSMDTYVNADLIGTPMEPFRLAHFYRDTLSLRLGSTFTVPRPVGGGRLSFSAGIYYDSSASPLRYTRLNYQAFSLLGFGIGASYKIRGVQLYLAYSRIWGGWGWPWNFKTKRRVERSCIQPVDPFEPPTLEKCDPYAAGYDPQSDINRGVYELSYDIVSLGFQITFEELLTNRPMR
jgi:long-subunit fatty acid transport protein